MRSAALFLEDIKKSCELVMQYTQEGKRVYMETLMIQDAVFYRFSVIGEAAKHVPEDVRNKYPEIPWKKMIAFRNVIAHEYPWIVLEDVWIVIESDLPDLYNEISQLLSDLNDG